MQSLNKVYGGEVVAVNLIDMKGDQLALGNAYSAAVARATAMGAKVKYEAHLREARARPLLPPPCSSLSCCPTGSLWLRGVCSLLIFAVFLSFLVCAFCVCVCVIGDCAVGMVG